VLIHADKCKIGNDDLQEVQVVVVPEHSLQLPSHAVQTLLIATYPLGHPDCHLLLYKFNVAQDKQLVDVVEHVFQLESQAIHVPLLSYVATGVSLHEA